MDCCGQPRTTLELRVADQPFVLHRCGVCNARSWKLDEASGSLEDVVAALRADRVRVLARRSSAASLRRAS